MQGLSPCKYLLRRHNYTLNQIRCRSYERPRRPHAELRHEYPSSIVCSMPCEDLTASQWPSESGMPARYTQVIGLHAGR